MIHPVIAIIGAGNMGSCLLRGLVAHGYPPQQLWISNPTPEKLSALKSLQVHTTTNNVEAAQKAEIILFAIKQKVLKNVAIELAPILKSSNKWIISTAAGIREESLRNWISKEMPIVRVMPNTPALIGCGISALHANAFVSAEQKKLAEWILNSVGTTVWIKDESYMDAITALSGCGPAYFFLVIEALQAAGEKLGLPKELASILTTQTALGAARMTLECDHSAAELRAHVASPGGSTEQALKVLEQENLREIFFKALSAAKNRAEELSKLFGS